MRTFEESTLMIEAEKILQSRQARSVWTYEAWMIVGDDRYEVTKMISMDIVEDYVNDYAPNIKVQMIMPLGTYVKRVLPFKEDLKILINRIPQYVNTDDEKEDEEVVGRYYRFIVDEMNAPDLTGSTPDMKLDEETINLMGLHTFKGELQDVVIEQLRTVSMGTVFVGNTPFEMLMGALSVFAKRFVTDEDNKVLGVSMVEPDNQVKQTQLIVPHGTRLVDLPDFVQNKIGVYNAGLGFFYSRRKFHLWPLYNYRRSGNDVRKMTLIIAPQNRFPDVERTYRTTANQTLVLITGGSNFIDPSDQFVQNDGSGVRFSNALNLLTGFAKVAGGIAEASRTRNVTEFIGLERANKINTVVSRTPTENIYKETSNIAARKGARMTAVWENSNHELLSPNMAIEVMVERNGLPLVIQATLLESHTYVATISSSITTKRHKTTTVLTLYLDKDLPELVEYRKSLKVSQHNKMGTV